MNITKDRITWLKDKLQSWPGEMLLTSYEIDDLLALLDDYEKVKAECDEWEKAAKLWKDGNYRLQAELARYQPLIEAAERARKSTLTTDRIFWGVDILRAALAYKESK